MALMGFVILAAPLLTVGALVLRDTPSPKNWPPKIARGWYRVPAMSTLLGIHKSVIQNSCPKPFHQR